MNFDFIALCCLFLTLKNWVSRQPQKAWCYKIGVLDKRNEGDGGIFNLFSNYLSTNTSQFPPSTHVQYP
jgi:hypothetical protein